MKQLNFKEQEIIKALAQALVDSFLQGDFDQPESSCYHESAL